MSNEYAVSLDNSGIYAVGDIQPNYSIHFSNGSKMLGTLNFNVIPPTFEGDMDGTARVFFDWLVAKWPHMLKERQDKELIEKLQPLRVDVYPISALKVTHSKHPDGEYLVYDDVVMLLGGEQGK
jgi:hypothetical protein